MKEVFEQALITLAIVTGLVLIAYIIVRICITSALKSKPVPARGVSTGIQSYYLPAASLTIKANATVALIKTLDGNVINASLQNLELQATSALEPDTSQLIMLDYRSDFFSSDDIKIVTGQNGLLKTVDTSTEDRIAKVVEQIANVPDEIVNQKKLAEVNLIEESPEAAMPIQTITELIYFSKEFYVSALDLIGNQAACAWNIPVNAGIFIKDVIASFSLKTEGYVLHQFEAGVSYNGLLTRPLKQVAWTAMPVDANVKLSELKIIARVPDVGKVINIPLTRFWFVKSTLMPRFTDGLLIENSVAKPSEIEGFINIPINILKALVSIPAQLLQFKILHNNRAAELETSFKNLLDAQAQTALARQDQQHTQLSDAIEKVRREVNLLPMSKADRQRDVDDLPKLGKQPADDREIDLESVEEELNLEKADFSKNIALQKLSATINDSIEFTRVATCDYTQKSGRFFDSYFNNQLKTCVPAAAAYIISVWTANASSLMIKPDANDVKKVYQIVSGNTNDSTVNDPGCNIAAFLSKWKNRQLWSYPLDNAKSVRIKDSELLKNLIYITGGCIVGLQMPKSAQRQTNWEINTVHSSDSVAGSWGGHAVAAVGYTDNSFTVISAGTVTTMSNRFYETYNDETWILYAQNFWPNGGTTPTNPPLTYSALKSEITHLILPNA